MCLQFVYYCSLNPTEVTQLYKSVADEAQTDLTKIVNQSHKDSKSILQR